MYPIEPASKPGMMSGVGGNVAGLVFHSIARSVRGTHCTAITIVLTAMTVLTGGAMFTLSGIRNARVRGEFLISIMSGVFLYLTRNKSRSAVCTGRHVSLSWRARR